MTTEVPDSAERRRGRPPRAAGAVEGLREITFSPVEPPSNEIARAIIDYILSGHVAAGDKLPSERQFAESFGIGRSIVREALKSLGLLGVVEFRHGGGTYFRGADSVFLPRVIEWGLLLGGRQASDLVEARKFLEQATARLAAERRTPEQLEAIEAALAAMERAVTTEQFVDADVAFHLAIADAAGNEALGNMLKSIAALLRVWIHRVMSAAETFEPSYREHVPVYEAIRDGDPEGAEAYMRTHMRLAGGRLIDTLSTASADGGGPDAD
ncbi:GntR family transcriptional repressor for pyruvate dehydrogenase complex [Microbacterium terrae]|uniref:HTH-type transcriptional regulator LutR n=1 Tax=Microbacterium terrae TaxID=69369 RepID=A0A0M2HIB7_9MICO|nr:FadR/GntR family transcriptional regulator [Microbacterium terrae]KJL44034.1 HTH-type transcriptional regulator LutR [Microbacterium terrae]MBP1079431.1 GntR family transcriptional repressor for pyruvate dehydrogenase complex [Microbacterium terrae]GLJ98831.1 transcriptional regulator [Microbacterium terrae]